MAMFGFVYAWYLMAVLLLELWFDYRHDFVVWERRTPGIAGWIYRVMTLGVKDLSAGALRLDARMGWLIDPSGVNLEKTTWFTPSMKEVMLPALAAVLETPPTVKIVAVPA